MADEKTLVFRRTGPHSLEWICDEKEDVFKILLYPRVLMKKGDTDRTLHQKAEMDFIARKLAIGTLNGTLDWNAEEVEIDAPTARYTSFLVEKWTREMEPSNG